MPYDFGDVVLVRFPFSSQANAKQRPAAVVSNRGYNDVRPDVVLVPHFATVEQDMIQWRLGTLVDSDKAALRALIAGVLG